MVDISGFTNNTTDPLIVAGQVISLILLCTISLATILFAAYWCVTMEDRVLGNKINKLSGLSVILMLFAGFIYVGGIINVISAQDPGTTYYISWLTGCLRGSLYAGVFLASVGIIGAGLALVTCCTRRSSTETPDPGAGTELDEIVGTSDQRDTTNPDEILTAIAETIGE